MPYSGRLLGTLGYSGSTILRVLFNTHFQLVQNTLSMIAEGKGLLLMDGATERSIRYFYPRLDSHLVILPIPAPSMQVAYASEKCNDNKLSVGYLGRLNDFKYSALYPFVCHQLGPLAKRKSVSLHLVSNGPRLNDVMRACQARGIEVHSHGFMDNHEARSLIKSQTNFAVSMGTSALDIAATGHPCIIIDPALSRFSGAQRLFRFVDQIEDFTLGEYRDFPAYRSGPLSFDEVLDRVLSDNSIGTLGREYVRKAHDPQSVFPRLFDVLLTSDVQAKAVAESVWAINRSFNQFRLSL